MIFGKDRWPSRRVATAEEDCLSFSAANNGQQGKSPGSEAGARLGFVCHGVTRDESDGNGYPPFSTTCIFWTTRDNKRSVTWLRLLARIRPLKSDDIDLALGGRRGTKIRTS
jgi:hypothetical protein